MSFWPGRGSRPANSMTMIAITAMMIQVLMDLRFASAIDRSEKLRD